ncbi:2,3-bisphosphoglycerate-independent phosphoglycerate mutase [Yunchengibacter salinarum]|uniref:2,3-bisphosphoglycerate-independent phosphoglycerate mutase n=1 Tax=Yunchengibacter salinarum TaxID=3133399 RepID=UPI0035B6A592
MTGKPVVLCILDGWGHREDAVDNAIAQADTPTYDRLFANCPRAWLKTSGEAVGLPDGQMGNSEVGHMNLGGGRVVMQDLPRIDSAIENGTLTDQPVLKDTLARIKAAGGTLHVMGLLSPGGVHSHQRHIAALVQAGADAGLKVVVHAFLDGRDTPPRSALDYLERFEADIAPTGATIATVTGRYFAMDRDKRWARVQTAFDAITRGAGQHTAQSARAAVEAAYERDENDEFVAATVVGDYAGMADGDGFIMANFRADRARQIMTALVDPDFESLNRDGLPRFSAVAGMTEYSSDLSRHLPAIFPAEEIRDSFGEVVSRAGLKQLRIAETEKYAHVTFFFNGGEETVFDGEERILVPSPDVATYDLQPEMSAPEVTDKLVDAIRNGGFGAIVANFANPDMVGHTGKLDAAIKAVETIDESLRRLEEAVTAAGGVLLITADHGNVELMADPKTGQAHTAHTSFDVPILMVGGTGTLNNGRLADVAPTMLALMGLDQPAAMTGKSLLKAGAGVRASA